MPPADKDAGSQGDEHVGVRRTCATASAGAFWNVAKTYEHLIRRSQNAGGVARRKLRRLAESGNRWLIPLELATPWLTDTGGRRRIGGSVGRVERCRRSEAGRLHWFGEGISGSRRAVF